MDHNFIIESLFQNRETFRSLLENIRKDEYRWRPAEDKWCLLEIVCHLYDEEIRDFGTRVKMVLGGTDFLPPSNPLAWVKENKYMEQDYEEMLDKFLKERDKTIQWLRSLKDPNWKSSFIHAEYGALTAEFFLANWAAHDYLHFHQISKTRYLYLNHVTGANLAYAGEW